MSKPIEAYVVKSSTGLIIYLFPTATEAIAKKKELKQSDPELAFTLGCSDQDGYVWWDEELVHELALTEK